MLRKSSAIFRRRRTASRNVANQGSAYIVVLLVLLLLMILGQGLALVTQTERLIGSNDRQITRALYAAEAGIAVTTAWMFEGNLEPHSLEMSRKQVGQAVITDRVQTSRVQSVGTSFSKLTDITHYSTGRQMLRHNYSFASTATRAAGDAQLAQKRIELMVELDPWDAGATRDLRTDTPEYGAEAEAESP